MLTAGRPTYHVNIKLKPGDFVHALRPPGRTKNPKLLPEHVGPLARFLVNYPRARITDVLAFALTELERLCERRGGNG